MITLTYAVLRDEQFAKAFGKISNFTGYKSSRTAYNVAQIARKIGDEFKILGKLDADLVKKFAHLDEAGNIAPVSPDRPGSFKIREEVQEDYIAARQDFDKVEVSISRDKLGLEDLVGVPLSPLEMLALEPLMKAPLEVV